MLKEKIYKTASDLLESNVSEIEKETLAALIGYKLTKLPYFKENYGDFILTQSKNGRVVLSNNLKSGEIVEIDFLIHEDNTNFIDKNRKAFLNKNDIKFLEKFKNSIKNAKSVEDLTIFFEENEEKIKFLFNIIQPSNDDYLLKILYANFEDKVFLKQNNAFLGFLNNVKKAKNKEDRIKKICELSITDFALVLFPVVKNLNYEKTDRLNIIKKIINNENLYNMSLIKICLEEKSENLKIKVYNKMSFKKDKNILLKKVSEKLKNTLILEDILNFNQDLINKGVNKIVNDFPMLLKKTSEKIKIEYYDKKEGVDSAYNLIEDFTSNQNILFYSDIEKSLSEFHDFSDPLVTFISDNEKYSCILIKDDIEIKAMAEIFYDDENDTFEYVNDLRFCVNRKYVNNTNVLSALTKSTLSFLQEREVLLVDINHHDEIANNIHRMLEGYENDYNLLINFRKFNNNFRKNKIKNVIVEKMIIDKIKNKNNIDFFSKNKINKLVYEVKNCLNSESKVEENYNLLNKNVEKFLYSFEKKISIKKTNKNKPLR